MMDLREEIADKVSGFTGIDEYGYARADAALECVEKWLRGKAKDGPSIEQLSDMTIMRVGTVDGKIRRAVLALADELAAMRGGK